MSFMKPVIGQFSDIFKPMMTSSLGNVDRMSTPTPIINPHA